MMTAADNERDEREAHIEKMEADTKAEREKVEERSGILLRHLRCGTQLARDLGDHGLDAVGQQRVARGEMRWRRLPCRAWDAGSGGRGMVQNLCHGEARPPRRGAAA